MVLPGRSGSGPKLLTQPTIWAPTSMISTGSTVPVALTAISKFARVTGRVRNLGSSSSSACQYCTATRPATTATSKKTPKNFMPLPLRTWGPFMPERFHHFSFFQFNDCGRPLQSSDRRG